MESVTLRGSDRMGTVNHSIWIEATPEQVWRIYVDQSRIPEWQTGSPTIEAVRGSGDQPGSTYVSRRRPGAARTTVMEVDKPRRLMTATEAYFGLRFDVTSLLESRKRSLLGSSDSSRATPRPKSRRARPSSAPRRQLEAGVATRLGADRAQALRQT